MKKLLMAAFFVCSFTACDTLTQLMNSTTGGGLTTQQITDGLKEALSIGTQNSANQLSAVDGFFANAAIKILMPPKHRM